MLSFVHTLSQSRQKGEKMTNGEAVKRIKEHIAIHKYRESHAIYIVEALDMAISALEERDVPDTNVGDIISRQAAIENSFEVYTKEYGWCEVVGVDAINSLPSAQPEPHWVSCSERLPEVSENILICDIVGDIYLGHRTRYGEYYADFCDDCIKNIRAWQPLPEPWRGENYEAD